VYGAEGCCDGPTTWTFSYNDGPTEEMTFDTLEALCPIPDP